MKGRIRIVKAMPYLNLLIHQQVVNVETIKELVDRYRQAPSLEYREVLDDLDALDIDDDKIAVYQYVCDRIREIQ